VCVNLKSYQTYYLRFNKTIKPILKIQKVEIFYSFYFFAILILELGESHVYVFLVLRVLDPHLYGFKMVSLIEEAKCNNENRETYLNKIVRKHNFICFVIIKSRANDLWANNLPLLDDDKINGVIINTRKETSSEAPLNTCI